MEASKRINDRYRIIRKIGEGGMAVVYLAQDENMHRQVAIKRLYIIGASEELHAEFVKRFQREAQAMAMLQHPHVVTSLDYGFDGAGAYLVLEYLPGGTLRERMDGAMPPEKALALIKPIAQALCYLHQRGIIHRDIKPENILFDGQDRPLLADLGIVKLIERGDGSTLTGTGVTIGTPAYMAPELIVGEVSPQTDQYALGIVLYELLTGRKPFEGRTPMETMTLQQNLPMPDPKTYVPELPESICWFLHKSLAKLPEDRFDGVKEFLQKLERIEAGSHTGFFEQPAGGGASALADDSGDQTEKKAARRKNRFPAWLRWAGAAVIVLGAVVGIASQMRKESDPEPTALALEISETPDFTMTPAPTHTLTVTPSPTLTKTGAATLAPTQTPTLGIGSSLIREKDAMPMMFVPEGEFAMGSFDGPLNEHPVHDVYLDAYWIDQFEVQNGQYEACVMSGICSNPFTDQSYTRSEYYGIEEFADYPVVWVNWNQAATYCQWAGGRLPTEAEWEKAARGTDGRRYPWGNDQPACEYLNLDSYLETGNCEVTDPVAVGSNPQGASPYGVMDMAGNVYEWTGDWYDASYYAKSAAENPSGPLQGTDRVLRGGYWSSPPTKLRTTFRHHLEPNSRWHQFGFRCVMDVK